MPSLPKPDMRELARRRELVPPAVDLSPVPSYRRGGEGAHHVLLPAEPPSPPEIPKPGPEQVIEEI